MRRPIRTTLQLLALALAAVCILAATLFMAYRETDRLAQLRQSESLRNAIAQHGRGLLREIKTQTIWGDAFRKTSVEPDRAWMRDFYGTYLWSILGYYEVMVLDGDDKPLYTFKADAGDVVADFPEERRELQDLIAAARSTVMNRPDTLTVTAVHLGERETLHQAISDTRLIEGVPTNVVVSTILPDSDPGPEIAIPERPPLMIAIYKLDREFLQTLGHEQDFDDLRWMRPGDAPDPLSLEAPIRNLAGNVVGTLAWRNDLPGREFLHRISGGFAIALALLAGIAVLVGRALSAQARTVAESQRREASLARTDFLTGLPNRLALSEALPDLVARAEREGTVLGVLIVDLDGFKLINDDHGHHVGDQALAEVARRLREHVPDCFAARTGGDEFVVLVSARSAERVAMVADRIAEILNEPVSLIEDLLTPLGASLGFAVAPMNGSEEEDLLRRSDLALFEAKRAARGHAVAFDARMEAVVLRRRMVEAALRRAVNGGAIGVAYQPILAEDGVKVVGVEALARWTDSDLGPIPPSEFIPVAEETGLIVRLGELVLRRALTDGLDWPDLTVAVNVSAQQIHQSDIVGTVVDILRETGFPAGRLEIELTESVLVADEARADAQIRGLRALGVSVALDDFGTGYSSLLYLRRFGFDKLKIDRHFVQDSDVAHEAKTMIESIVGMSRSLGLTVTAEGVENDGQHAFLRGAGCDQMQGFLFSGPVGREKMDEMVQRRPVWKVG